MDIRTELLARAKTKQFNNDCMVFENPRRIAFLLSNTLCEYLDEQKIPYRTFFDSTVDYDGCYVQLFILSWIENEKIEQLHFHFYKTI